MGIIELIRLAIFVLFATFGEGEGRDWKLIDLVNTIVGI